MWFLQRKADKCREAIRQRIIEGRDAHTVALLIIAHTKADPEIDYWERAAVYQIMSIYKLNVLDACAIVSEMS